MLQRANSAEYNQKKSPRPIMRAATWLNVTYGLFEAYIGGSTGSSAALANGVHNAADGVSHAMHTSTHIAEHSENHQLHTVQLRRKIAAGAIAAGALLTGANAVDTLIHHEQQTLNVQAVAVELGAVAMNGGLILAIRRRNDGTLAYSDALRHHKIDGAIATGTTMAILFNQYFEYADGIGGLGATAASMYLACKTFKNNEH